MWCSGAMGECGVLSRWMEVWGWAGGGEDGALVRSGARWCVRFGTLRRRFIRVRSDTADPINLL